MDYDPVVSLEGSWLVFCSERRGNPGLYALDLEPGGGPHLFIDNEPTVSSNFGPSRRQDLAFRHCVRQWQPQLRALFLLRISSLGFRLRLQGFELPDSVRQLHREYDYRSAEVLDEVANRIDGSTPGRARAAPDTSGLLDRMLRECCTDEALQFPASRIQSFVNLVCAIDDLTTTHAGGITAAFE